MLKNMTHFRFSLFLIFLLSLYFCKKPADAQTTERRGIKRGVVMSRVGLLMRAEPAQKGKVLKNIPVGTELLLISKSEKEVAIDYFKDFWYKVGFGNAEGWVFGGYLYSLSRDEPVIVTGIYEEQMDLGVKPVLLLRSDKKFQLQVNSCEYLPIVTGNYSIEADLFKFIPSQKDQNVAKPFTMYKQRDKTLILKSDFKFTNGKEEWTPCAPEIGARFRPLFEHGS